ncbi:MAG: DUF6146 family protein [Bacteroidota bacterium]
MRCRYVLLFFVALGLGWSLKAQMSEVQLNAEEVAIFDMTNSPTDTTATEEETEYDIIIMDIGFGRWLNQIAQPKGYYSQRYMEQRNRIYVLEWNRRFLEPTRFDALLYETRIDYDPTIDYGYDLNYQLYNYFIYFQRRYKQRLGPFLPRI